MTSTKNPLHHPSKHNEAQPPKEAVDKKCNPTFSESFKVKVGADMDITSRALSGVAPDRLNITEIAILMGAMDSGNLDDQVYRELAAASARKMLKADPTHINHLGKVDHEYVDFIVHRDDARRYFKSLDHEPPEGSPLWCWLNKKRSEDAGKLRGDQQDKADFQQLCRDHWEINPTTTIRGESGVVAQVGVAYLRLYKPATLARWASEVASEMIKKPGRPKKRTSRRK